MSSELFVVVYFCLGILILLGFGLAYYLFLRTKQREVPSGDRQAGHNQELILQEHAALVARLEIAENECLKLQERLSVNQKELSQEIISSSELRVRIEEREKAFKVRERQLEKTQSELAKNFELISNRIFAEQDVKQKKGLHELLSPFKEQMGEFRKRLEEVHREETKDRASLMSEVKTLHRASEKVNEEAGNLTRALKGDIKIQGDWGEVILQRVLEQSGLRLNHEYFLQATKRTEQGQLKRPDAIVRLPEGKEVIIDAKVSLLAYQEYQSSSIAEEKEQAVKNHLMSLRSHITRLSEQDYELLPDVKSQDFVLLFVPIEPAFNLAMQMEPKLFNEAYDKSVVVVTPTTLSMTLRIIEGIWRVENQNRNAQEIARQAGGLYDKFRSLTEDMETLNNQLSTVQRTYDTAFGKMIGGRGNLVRRVERLRELGAPVKKSLSEELLEKAPDDTIGD